MICPGTSRPCRRAKEIFAVVAKDPRSMGLETAKQTQAVRDGNTANPAPNPGGLNILESQCPPGIYPSCLRTGKEDWLPMC